MMKKLVTMVLALVLALGMTACFAAAEDETVPMPAEAAVFEGVWECDRATAEVYWEEEGFRILISWGSSAWETTQWEYSAYFHAEDNTVVTLPFGRKTDFVYGDDGEEISATEIYDDGEAVFYVDEEGYLIWQDLKDNAGEGMRFEKMPEQEAEADPA